MTGPNRFDDQRGVILHGNAYSREHIFGVKVKCYIVLKMSVSPPHAFEKYDNVKSQNANTIYLENVIVNASGKRSFEMISNGKVIHHFTLESDVLAADWVRCLKNLSTFKSDLQHSNGGQCGFDVKLLSSAPQLFPGQYRLGVTATNISLFQNANAVSLPLKYIRSYGIDKDKFILNTGHATVTGRSKLIFEVLKPWKHYNVYHEVASRISPIGQVDVPNVPVSATEPQIVYSEMDANSSIYDLIGSSSSSSGSDRISGCVALNEPTNSQGQHFSVPPNLGMTLGLPCKSFSSIYGLKDCIAHLKNLLGTRSCSRSTRFLLYGAPHSGKRSLVNALATELQTCILCLRCTTLSTALDDDSVGVLKETFDRFSALNQCVFFFADVDVVPSNFHNSRIGNEVLDVIVNFLERSISNPELVIVCSTAFPYNLDDRLRSVVGERLYVPLPPEPVRLQIIRNQCQASHLVMETTFTETLARRTSGFSTDELIALFNDFRYVQSPIVEADAYRHLEEAMKRTSEVMNPEIRLRNIAASASYYAAQNASQGTFFVMLEKNSAIPNVSSCFLFVTPSGLELRDLDPSHSIIVWTSRTIQGFGADRTTFSLQIKRSNATEHGFFTFRTNKGVEIQNFIMTRWTARTIQNGPL